MANLTAGSLARLQAFGILFYLVLHLPGVDAPPNGFHLWRESDTASVAENFVTDDASFLTPKVSVFGFGETGSSRITGMELPVYNYLTSLLYRVFGFSHAWPRLLSAFAGLLLAYAVGRIAYRVTKDRRTSLVATYLSAFSPLVLFYSQKIQPDVLGLALALSGVAAFFAWVDERRVHQAFLATVFLCIAGAIKPTFLACGLPMLWYMIHRQGRLLFQGPAVWLMAAGILGPIVLWFDYARGLSEGFGKGYFYLGEDLFAELAGLRLKSFYQNTLLTWPFELAVGLPAMLLVGFGVFGRSGGPLLRMSGLWLLGCYVVFVLSAMHCATPHDYYYLPAVPAFAWMGALGVRRLLGRLYLWRQVAVATLLLVTPFVSYARISQRIDPHADFNGLRAAVRSMLPRGTIAVAIESTPSYLLYRTGLRGYPIGPDPAPGDLDFYLLRGATVAILTSKLAAQNERLAGALGPKVFEIDGIAVHHIGPPKLTAAP